MASNQPKSRERWGTRIGVILAVAGSAVGLGNFLRFPGQAAQNGGGAFMIPYFVSLLILGIPLCWAEWTMGRYGGMRGFNSSPGVYSTIWRNPLAKYLGALAILVPLIIYMYYVVIEAWCLGYALKYLDGSIMNQEDYGAVLGSYIGADQDGAVLEPGRRGFLWILLSVFVLNFGLIYRGVSKGIEKFCTIAMPLMVICAICVLVRVLTLGTPDPSRPDQSVIGGLGFMWNPDFEALKNPQTWLAASGQIFFSLSVGFGIIINFASYLRRDDDVVLSGLTASSMNEFFEVCLGGLITLPAAFIFLGATMSTSTFGLGFIALPNVFNQMPGGQFFGFLWFFMLFLAAVTSSISMLQPVIAFFEEGFGLQRHGSAAILGLLSAIGCGFVVYFSAGTVALDTMDFWVGTFIIYVLAMVQAILYGWVFGIDRGESEAHQGAHIRIPRIVQYVLKYVTPLYLVVIFGAFCSENLPSNWKDPEVTPSENVPEWVRIAAVPGVPQEQTLSYVVRDGETGVPQSRYTATDGGFVVESYSEGWIEKIGRQPIALAAILFILVVLAFLLLMVRIAGVRWRGEGRFDHVAEDGTLMPLEDES